MSMGTNEITMRGTYVFHHSPETLHFLDVDLALPPLGIDDDPPTVVSVVPRFDQNVDLSPDARDGTLDPSVRSHAKLGRQLIRYQASDQTLVEFPVFPNVLQCERSFEAHTPQLLSCYII